MADAYSSRWAVVSAIGTEKYEAFKWSWVLVGALLSGCYTMTVVDAAEKAWVNVFSMWLFFVTRVSLDRA